MNLQEFTSSAGNPVRKPWLNIVANTIECQDATVHGRISQENGQRTPYTVWASTNDFTLVTSGVSTFAMGTYSGPAEIPATSLYPGHSTRIKIGGSITTAGADNIQFSIRDLAGAYTYANVTLAVPGAIAATPFEASFDIQIAATGGAGVGKMRSTAQADLGTGAVSAVFNITDNAGFSSTAGVGYYLYMSHSTAGNSVTKALGYATVLY